MMMKAIMSVNARSEIVSDRMELHMTRNNVLLVIVSSGSWKAGPVEGTVTSVITYIEPNAFSDEMRERVWW